MNIQTDNNQIIINSHTVVFQYEVEKHLVIDNIIVVLIKGIETENIYGIDKFGKLIWQIEKHDFIQGQKNCIYTEISIYENKLAGYNFCGFFCIIDHKTGKLLSVEFSK